MDVELYADPSCPWSWAAFLWLDQVAARRQLRVAVRPFSLLARDGAGQLPPARRAVREQAHRALRVTAAIPAEPGRTAFFAAVTAPMYAAPTRHSAPLIDIAAALGAAHLDPALAARADDTDLDAEIERNMRSVAELLAVEDPREQRIPVLVLHAGPGPIAWQGPLLDPPPRGRAALQLWDATEQLLAVPGVYGMTRPRPARHSLVAAAG